MPGWPDNRNLPEFNMNEARDIIFTWLDLVTEAAASEAPPFNATSGTAFARIAAVADDLKLAADKSSYLGRRFSGEIHRTEPCPKHQGRWSGLGECEYGCEKTGWLPRIVPKGDPA